KDNTPFLLDSRLVGAVIQAGHSSCMEMIYLGIPFLVVPDQNQPEQIANAIRCEELGIAIKLEYKKLSANSLNENLERIVEEDEFRKRITFLSKLSRGFNPSYEILERALYFAERYEYEKKERSDTRSLEKIKKNLHPPTFLV
ncbi:MAG: glycosyltransferase, partial [Candidatus Freyarchaeota archaeon]